jgi:hypothetical protein
MFEKYVNGLKRQHGILGHVESDLPIFEPSLTVKFIVGCSTMTNLFVAIVMKIMGPLISKDTSIIGQEDSRAIEQLLAIEPRKKYALVHERLGIFIIGSQSDTFERIDVFLFVFEVDTISSLMYLSDKSHTLIIYSHSMDIQRKFPH